MSLTNGVGGIKRKKIKNEKEAKIMSIFLMELILHTIMMSVFADNSNNNEIPLIKPQDIALLTMHMHLLYK